MGAAHRQNIVHRDLKPLNIMVQEGVPVSEGVKILDFGLAKIKSGELLGSFVQAQTSGLMGSPFYMAPEQWSDEEPDARADIYSLGVILYQMLCGEVPFKGSSIPSIMKKHLTLPPPSFQSMGVIVPPAVEAVVRHALEKEVAARVDSASTFLKELKAAVNSMPLEISIRQTGALDPNQTIASAFSNTGIGEEPLASTALRPPVSNETQLAFDSLAGTVSSNELDEDVQSQISDSAATRRLHKAEEERREREQRESDSRRFAAEAKEREREEARLKEQQEREAREREQQEKFERMAEQAKELEDRLERLSVSINPAADPETTHLQQSGSGTQVVTGAPVTQILTRSQPVIVGVHDRKRTPLLLVAAGLIVLALAGAGVGAYLIFRPKTGPVVTNPIKTPPVKSVAVLEPVDGGNFLMGRNKGPVEETPAHPIEVRPFLMDRTEVTNSDYADFIRDTNYSAPNHWNGPKPPFGQEKWPVVNVSLDDATAYAAWRSKRDHFEYRLPTEEEWEYAARNGGNEDMYPWGKDWQEGLAVLKEATPSDVGSRPDNKNKWGVVDLIGNVWEWTSTRVAAYPGNPVTIPSSTKDWVTIRGGCYVSDPAKPDKPVSSCMREFVPPSTKTTLLGFRLVRSTP